MKYKSITWPDGSVTYPSDKTAEYAAAVAAAIQTHNIIDNTNLPYVFQLIKKELKPSRKTAEEWQTENPVLAENIQGYESDTNRLKYGDGVTAWNDLPYVQAPSNVTVSVLPTGSETWIEVPAETMVIGGTEPNNEQAIWVELEGE